MTIYDSREKIIANPIPILCIGGAKDGEWVTFGGESVEFMVGINFGEMNPDTFDPCIKYTKEVYIRNVFRFNDKIFDFYKPVNQSNEETMALLFAGYRTKRKY